MFNGYMHVKIVWLQFFFQDAKSIGERDAFFCQEMNFEVLEFDSSPRYGNGL